MLELTVEEDGIIYNYDFARKMVTVEKFLRHDALLGADSDGTAIRREAIQQLTIHDPLVPLPSPE